MNVQVCFSAVATCISGFSHCIYTVYVGGHAQGHQRCSYHSPSAPALLAQSPGTGLAAWSAPASVVIISEWKPDQTRLGEGKNGRLRLNLLGGEPRNAVVIVLFQGPCKRRSAAGLTWPFGTAGRQRLSKGSRCTAAVLLIALPAAGSVSAPLPTAAGDARSLGLRRVDVCLRESLLRICCAVLSLCCWLSPVLLLQAGIKLAIAR